MAGYYILAGILFVFFIGTGCIITDIIVNKEPEVIVIRKPKPKPAYRDKMYEEDDDEIMADADWEDLNTDSFRNS